MKEQIKAQKNIIPLISKFFTLIDIMLLIIGAYAGYENNQVNGVYYAEFGKITGQLLKYTILRNFSVLRHFGLF